MVREGDSDRTLSIALGHIPGTAFPGQQGNVGIAGHRDTLFRGLKNIAPGDEITFETPRASYVYRVKTTQIVKPEQTEVLKPGPDRELTLVTCFPFEYVGAAPDRFIVKARLVSQHVSDNNNTVQNQIHDEPAPVAVAAHPPVPSAAHHEIAFNLPEGHSRELVPGKIWVGLSTADSIDKTIDGWVWVMPDRRTVWLRNVDTHHPAIFYQDGQKLELVITGVERTSAKGYLIKSPVHG
jgi:LPXTG-site transpeptidase (sortase) family protein